MYKKGLISVFWTRKTVICSGTWSFSAATFVGRVVVRSVGDQPTAGLPQCGQVPAIGNRPRSTSSTPTAASLATRTAIVGLTFFSPSRTWRRVCREKPSPSARGFQPPAFTRKSAARSRRSPVPPSSDRSRLYRWTSEGTPNQKPAGENGERPDKLFQWLSDEIGHPLLSQHLYSVIMFQRLAIANAHGWKRFYRMVDQVHPKKGQTFSLPMMEPDPTPSEP